MFAGPNERVILPEIDPRPLFIEAKALLDLPRDCDLRGIALVWFRVSDRDYVDEVARAEVAADDDDRGGPVFSAGSLTSVVFATP
jgi:hypothetical protein